MGLSGAVLGGLVPQAPQNLTYEQNEQLKAQTGQTKASTQGQQLQNQLTQQQIEDYKKIADAYARGGGDSGQASPSLPPSTSGLPPRSGIMPASGLQFAHSPTQGIFYSTDGGKTWQPGQPPGLM